MLNSKLVNLRRDFTTLCREDIEPRCMAAFYETGKSSLPRKLIPWLPAFLAQEKPLVNEESATLDVIRNPLALNRTHLLMNKFPSPYDNDYNLVAGRIRIILERIQMQEDASQFSLHSRLKIKTPPKGKQVNLWHLFGQRKEGDMDVIQPKRILIRGHAGVGKSTLCKKIVHDFKELHMWRNMFVRILWVPLRNLKRLAEANCNLEAMLHERYFSQTSKGKKFAYELWKELEADNYKETLFILDGLDEVYEGLEKDSHMFNLLETLLRLPAVIVTSRPHVSLADRFELKFDQELETIGFYPDQVKSYIENVFTIPGEKEPDRQRIDSLQLLLQQHQLLQGLSQFDNKIVDALLAQLQVNGWLAPGQIIQTLVRQPRRREEILPIIAAQLKHKDSWVQFQAVQSLEGQPDLSDDIFRKLTTSLADEAISTQESVLKLLGSWPRPNNKILDIIRAQLEDQNYFVRKAAITTLAGWPQLSRDVLDVIKARAQDEDEDILFRTQAILVLVNNQQPIDGIDDIITAWLQDEGFYKRRVNLGAIEGGYQFIHNIAGMAVARLRENPRVILKGALYTLMDRRRLNNDFFDVIALHRSDSEENLQVAAAKSSQTRPQLKNNTIKAIMAQLKSPQLEGNYGFAQVAFLNSLLRALGKWPRLDDSVLYAVARLRVPTVLLLTAVYIFLGRPQPQDNIIEGIMEHLKRSNGRVRTAVLKVVGNWPQLSDEFLITIAAQLGIGVWDVRREAFYALTNQLFLPLAALEPYIELMYKVMYKVSLEISFKEHVYWLTEDGKSCIVVGTRKVYWENTRDHAVRKSEAESNPGSDHARQLHDRTLEWRKEYGF
ncbi:hypothetical protein NUW58_g5652 [Xylaria curta]|uniref:Uncharacterized protein n=1 Tax=Xylaria curta TaxID=42375 RepID=A0ACC1P2T2_9PEZI|nr:hypothetical protein NUW58_g5652 [Xylaria curta]